MDKIVVKAVHRTTIGKQVRALRREGKLPGVIYGHNIEATPIQMDLREATRILPRLTASHLITIDLEGKEYTVLVREKQRDFIRNILKHVDFQVVSMTEIIRSNVAIIIEGESPAVKDSNALVMTGLTELHVEALPGDLPERFTVDISTMTKVGDSIAVRDIPVAAGVTVLDNPEDMVVLISAGTLPTEEEEEAEVPVGEEPEVIERGKKEDEDED